MPSALNPINAILWSRVQGTSVFNISGETIGNLADLMLDKSSGRPLFAIIGVGGLLGIGRNYYPIPWDWIKYDESLTGYVASVSKDVLRRLQTSL